MKNTSLKLTIMILFVVLVYSAVANSGSITLPTPTFTDGDVLKASQLQGNFTEIETQVDDNDARITSLVTSTLQSGSTTDTALRIIRGSVNISGSITLGSGFSLVNSSTGVYDITYDTPLTVSATVTANTWTLDGYIRVNSTSQTVIRLRVFNSSGALTNAGFHFIAIGQ